ATAVHFILLGAALILLGADRESATLAAQGIAAVIIVMSGMALLGNFVDVDGLFKVRGLQSMPLHTALAFFALGTGVLGARPADGWVNDITAGTASARMGRRLLASLCIVMPVLGWVRLEGQRRGWYGPEFGI